MVSFRFVCVDVITRCFLKKAEKSLIFFKNSPKCFVRLYGIHRPVRQMKVFHRHCGLLGAMLELGQCWENPKLESAPPAHLRVGGRKVCPGVPLPCPSSFW